MLCVCELVFVCATSKEHENAKLLPGLCFTKGVF